MLNKRGQIFLIAAVIIAGIIISAYGIINYASPGVEGESFYDLADEIGFETKRVLDYGVFNSVNTEQIVKQFLENYADYIAREEVLFVFGDGGGLRAMHFTPNSVIGTARIITGGINVPIKIDVTGTTYAFVSHWTDQGKINVRIRDIIYQFEEREGQKFYFVIIKEDENERFVATE